MNEYWDKDIDGCVRYLHGVPKKTSTDQKFKLILRLLRKDFPAEYPVKVRRVGKSLSGNDAPFGDCSLVNASKSKNKRYFLIRLSKTEIWPIQFDTLLHEWAHCLTWNLVEEDKGHGDVFHRKYGVLYRQYVEE